MAINSNRPLTASLSSPAPESLVTDVPLFRAEELSGEISMTESTSNLLINSSTTAPANSSPNSLPPSNSPNGRTISTSRLQRDLAWQVAPNVFLSFRYAWAGVGYALATQRNLRIHTIIGTIALGLSLFLHLPVLEVAVIGLTIALVLAMELLNTAIESVVDLLVKQSYHELAKIAKDCAAGAVLVAALASVFVAGLLLLPPLYQKLIGYL